MVAIAVAALILVPAVAQPLIGLIRNPAPASKFAGNFQVYSWSPLNALRRDFFTADGHLAYSQPNGVYYAEAPANFAYFGPLLAVWILPRTVGRAAVADTHYRADRRLGGHRVCLSRGRAVAEFPLRTGVPAARPPSWPRPA